MAVPFLAVDLPPLADLPQHAAQVRLFTEALAPGSPYAVQWGTPYSLVYLLLAAVRALVAPWGGEVAAARLGAMVVAMAWAGALHLLAWRLRRPPAAAVLGSLLVFSHVLYWGFLPFLAGFPLFALWLLWLRRAPTRGWREAAGTAALATAVYLTHALWFAAALGWLVIETALEVRRGHGLRRRLPRLAAGGLVAALAAAWFVGVSGTSFATPPLWVPGAWRRLLPGAWVEAAFGGLRGGGETLALAAVLAWLAAAAWHLVRRRRERSEEGTGDGPAARGADARLALVGGAFLLAALVLPDKFVNTIEFHDRWMPPALALLLLALPAPRLPRWLAGGLATAALATFVIVTSGVWQRVERHELAGVPAALESLPAAPRVLGLDFVRTSRWLDHEPFLQTFAWSQVAHGGELNFSFADFAPSLVVYRPPRDKPWTGGLEWYPQLVRPGDFGWFDYVLVRAHGAIHEQFAAAAYLTPVTPPAPWRLYRVGAGAPRAVSPRPEEP